MRYTARIKIEAEVEFDADERSTKAAIARLAAATAAFEMDIPQQGRIGDAVVEVIRVGQVRESVV